MSYARNANIEYQNGFVINARFSTASVVHDSQRTNGTKKGRYSYTAVYPPPPLPVDLSIKRGDVLWTRKAETPVDEQQPFVRSCLNGASVIISEGRSEAEQLESEMQVLGFSRKDVIYNAKNPRQSPSDDPVIVASALITTINTGADTIKPGDGTEWYLVPESMRRQVNDGITTFSDRRIVPGLRPHRIETSLKELCKDKVFKSKWDRFFNLLTGSFLPVGKTPIDGALDRIVHALVKPIAKAYSSTVAIATSSAPAGGRLEAFVIPPAKLYITSTNLNFTIPTVDPLGVTTGTPGPEKEDDIEVDDYEKKIRDARANLKKTPKTQAELAEADRLIGLQFEVNTMLVFKYYWAATSKKGKFPNGTAKDYAYADGHTGAYDAMVAQYEYVAKMGNASNKTAYITAIADSAFFSAFMKTSKKKTEAEIITARAAADADPTNTSLASILGGLEDVLRIEEAAIKKIDLLMDRVASETKA